MRRIRRCGRVYVYVKLLCGGNSRRIAIAVAAVIGAVRRNVFPLGRLRELPDFGEADAALRGAWGMSGRTCRQRAAGPGRTRVVARALDDVAPGGALANMLGGN